MPTSQVPENEIDLSQIMRTLWRGKFLITLVSLIAVFLGGYYAYVVATPVYTSSAVVALESREPQVVDLESVVTGLSGDQVTINTEVEVMRSRGLIEKLVNRLDLVQDPEFNELLRTDSGFSVRKLISSIRVYIFPPEDTAGSKAPKTEQEILDAVIDSVLSTIRISNIRQSYVFQITAVTQAPKKSLLIANTLADLYILDQLEAKFEATEKATNWLTERVDQLKVELEVSETAVKDFDASTDLINAETLSALNRQLKELRDRLGELKNEKADAEVRLNSLKIAAASNDIDEMSRVAADTSLARVLSLVNEGVANGQSLFESRYNQILSRAELNVNRAESQAVALSASIVGLEEQIQRQSSDLLQLQQLKREAGASRSIYEYFLGRLKETSVQQGIQQADSRLLSRAVLPQRASAPRKRVILMISILLGGFIGASIVIFREFAQSTFRTSEDLEKMTGYSVLGQIPMIPTRSRKNTLKYLTEKPTSAAAEAIRNLRTSVLLSNVDKPPQVIMSTSSIPGEGKTTQSLALAQNLSGLGKKVVLIEGDIRRRVFAEYFDIKNKKGLLSILSGEATVDEAASYNETLKADIIIGEKSSTNAADIFSSEKFSSLLKTLRKNYDFIIIDTPPVLVVPDARVIGQSVDAILYTVKWDSTSPRQVQEGLKSFEHVGLKVTGLVLGQINARGMKHYGYGNGYGGYGKYYDN